MTIGQHLSEARELLARSGMDTPDLDARALMAHVLGVSAARLLAMHGDALPPEAADTFRDLLARRSTGVPVAYLTGQKEFYGRMFRVDNRCLIPRPETELLVELALEGLAAMPAPAGRPLGILDCCTGSGCIGITLERELAFRGRPARVLCTDLSPGALAIAGENSARLGCTGVEFLASDLLDAPEIRKESWDMVVSNPPYVPSGEVLGGPARTWGEPLMALDGGNDGLDPYRRLVPAAYDILVPGGMLFLESGWDQGGRVLQLLADSLYSGGRCHPDLAGLDRVVSGRK